MTSIIILWLLIIILSIFLIRQLNINKNLLICIGISILIIIFTLNINTCIPAALNGAVLWYKAILPTTFPFLIICNLLISYDGINSYSKILGPLICKPLGLSKNCSFPIVASILCGYPLGAKYSADLYTMGYLEKDEYINLLNIASNAGPLFIVGTVGSALLNNTILGYVLLIGNYISCIIIGFLIKKKRTHKIISSPCNNSFNNMDFGNAIKTAIENGISTVLSIGGFIIIFSVIISLIKSNSFITFAFNNIENLFNIPQNSLYSFFLGTIEITNGCNMISLLSISTPLKVASISFLCSFSGLAILAQVSSFISSTKINFIHYTFWKFIQGIISFIITYIIIKTLPLNVYSSQIHVASSNNIISYFIPVLILIITTLIIKITHKLFFHAS